MPKPAPVWPLIHHQGRVWTCRSKYAATMCFVHVTALIVLTKCDLLPYVMLWNKQARWEKNQLLIKTLRGPNDKNWELGRMKIDFSKIMFLVCTWPIRVDWIRWGRRGVGSNFPPAASESNQHLNWPHHPIHTLCCQLHIPVYGLSEGCSMFNAVLILLAAHHYEKSTFHAML